MHALEAGITTLNLEPGTLNLPLDPIAIIHRYYPEGSGAEKILIAHGRQVADKALKVAQSLSGKTIDPVFLEEAALLHDIGMMHTDAPAIDCHGPHPYVCHGLLGKEMLEAQGLPAHGRICERHVGAGISQREILQRKLPLPPRDMIPVTLAEEIVCYADKFFSKNGSGTEKSLPAVRAALAPYGPEQLARFDGWVRRFEPHLVTKRTASAGSDHG